MYVNHLRVTEDLTMNTISSEPLSWSTSHMLIPCWEAFLFACGEMEAIVTVDNYAREQVGDQFICYVETRIAEKVAGQFNYEDQNETIFYTHYTCDNRMSQGMLDFI